MFAFDFMYLYNPDKGGLHAEATSSAAGPAFNCAVSMAGGRG
jgi:hypothetical protein